MEYPVLIFDGSYVIRAFFRGHHAENNNSGLIIDKLSRKHQVGEVVSEDEIRKPVLAMEFEKDKSIENIIKQLEYIRDYKYNMFETIICYKGVLVEA